MKIESVENVSIIKVIGTKGNGTDESPIREVTQYWGLDNKLMEEIDAYKESRYTNIVNQLKKEIEDAEKTLEEKIRTSDHSEGFILNDLTKVAIESRLYGYKIAMKIIKGGERK